MELRAKLAQLSAELDAMRLAAPHASGDDASTRIYRRMPAELWDQPILEALK